MFRDYSILERNWRCGHLEVDIIALKRGLLVFVEVKTLTSADVILPEEHADKEKRKHIIAAAKAYMGIISVTGAAPPFSVRHIENAFEVEPKFFAI